MNRARAILFYFAEEVLSTFQHKKSIRVTDRATCFNLILGLNGYTPSAGIYIEELGGGDLICKPLALDETIHIGAIAMKDSVRSEIGRKYLEFLKKISDRITADAVVVIIGACYS